MNYFKNVFWFGANTGSETYPDAGASIQSFVYGGGNFFMNAPQYWRRDSTFVWFPLDSVRIINPNGRLYPNRDVLSLVDSSLDLRTSYTIGNRLKAIYPNIYEDGELISQQFPTTIGKIDILAKDKKNKNYVVIELKKNQTSDDTIGQLSRYMGWIRQEKKDENVKGIIVAGAFDEKLKYAKSELKNSEAFLYEVDFKIKEFK